MRWLAERADGGAAEPAVGRGEPVPLRAELLPLGGAISNPRARTIDTYPRWPGAVAAIAVLALSLIGWGLTCAALWGLKSIAILLWRWAEPVLTIIGVGVALAVIAYGIAVAG